MPRQRRTPRPLNDAPRQSDLAKPVARDSVLALVDAFLDWCQKNRSSETYHWYLDRLQRFAKAISGWPEVLECYLMTGHRDYLLRVVVADLSEYEQFLKQKLTRLSGISSIESSFALDQIKYSIALPV